MTETAKNRHGCLIVLYFVGQANGGQGALQNRQNNVTGKSLDSPEKGNVDKMSEKCPEELKSQFSDIFGIFLPIWSIILRCCPIRKRAEYCFESTVSEKRTH